MPQVNAGSNEIAGIYMPDIAVPPGYHRRRLLLDEDVTNLLQQAARQNYRDNYKHISDKAALWGAYFLIGIIFRF